MLRQNCLCSGVFCNMGFPTATHLNLKSQIRYILIANIEFDRRYTTGKNYGIFSISAILCIFCGAWSMFRCLKYIPTSRHYFLGANSQLTAKWTAKFENSDFGLFFTLDSVYNSCRFIVRCLPYPIVCCIEILQTIPLFIHCLIWCDQQGISIVGASRRRKLWVGLACHKVMFTKPYPVTNNRSFHTE